MKTWPLPSTSVKIVIYLRGLVICTIDACGPFNINIEIGPIVACGPFYNGGVGTTVTCGPFIEGVGLVVAYGPFYDGGVGLAADILRAPFRDGGV